MVLKDFMEMKNIVKSRKWKGNYSYNMFPEFTMLISDLESKGVKRMVETRMGNWYPLKEEDTVI